MKVLEVLNIGDSGTDTSYHRGVKEGRDIFSCIRTSGFHLKAHEFFLQSFIGVKDCSKIFDFLKSKGQIIKSDPCFFIVS